MAHPNGSDDDNSHLATLRRMELELLFLLPPPALQELELLLLGPPPQEPLMVPPQEPPFAVAPPPMLADAPPMTYTMLLAAAGDPQFAMAPPPMLADAPPPVTYTLPAAAAGDPPLDAPAAGVGGDEEEEDDDGFPRNGSYLLEMADAILDDGSGRQATDEDVDRLLREHGLESFIKPKPKPPM